MIELICKQCGKKFIVKECRKDAQFCSPSCHGKWRTAHKAVHARNCKLCGKEFFVSNPSSKRVYCSADCGHKARITKVTKTCEQCGTIFEVIKTRENTSKYCCRACSDLARKKEPNIYCDICGKPIHRKLSHCLKNKHGQFCSKVCVNKWKEQAYKGEGNHQYGLKGPLNSSFRGDIIKSKNNHLTDFYKYCPTHPFATSNKRVLLHRYLVEQNYTMFDSQYFIQIENKYYLKPGIHVHHLNGNHEDNQIENLIPCTETEHHLYHALMLVNPNKVKEIIENVAAVTKRGELLETLEVGNQQPSQPLTKLEGSETNS